jgi:hypothetical protein
VPAASFLGGLLLGTLLLGTILLGGCATVPRPVHEEPVRLLIAPDSAVISCNLQRSRSFPELLFSRFMEPEDVDRFLERMNMIHIVLRPSGGSEVSFTILGEGDFPRRLSNVAFGNDEQWEKRKEPLVWWEHGNGVLQIAVLPDGYLLISNGRIRADFEQLFGGTAGTVPASVRESMRSAAVSLYAPSTGELLRGMAGGAESGVNFSAVESLEASLSTADDGFNARGRFTLDEAGKARAFALGFRLLLISSARSEGPERVQRIIREAEVKSKDRTVLFSGIPLTARHIEELLDSLVRFPSPAGIKTAARGDGGEGQE